MMRAEKSEYLKLMAKNKISMEELPLSPDIGKMALAFNKPELQRVEIPSANCHGSARGMAKLASVMANLGKYPSSGDNKDEKSLMSNETWKKMHEGEKLSVDANLIGSSELFQLMWFCNNDHYIVIMKYIDKILYSIVLKLVFSYFSPTNQFYTRRYLCIFSREIRRQSKDGSHGEIYLFGSGRVLRMVWFRWKCSSGVVQHKD